ncbi:MAG: transglycosylase domain-containing protein [Bacteroidetes bacterium]|nr:transglycosylase domain-containing protein [Bacteroidota bacterium]MBS1591445.1 transglycosylase domain-containing protein [Bacteroidota bacterium]
MVISKAVKIFWRVFFISIASFILFLLLCNWGVFGEMPSIEDIQNPSASLSSQVYAQDGTLMGKYYLEDRVNVEYKDISKHVINALVATEDERFYEHSGIDLRSLLRAVKGLGRDGGASTITMQTAKNLFTDYKRNAFVRTIQKFKEAIIAIKLERNFTKNEIITLYLNTVPFGDNVYGIRNAAKTFFQKEPDRLNVEEAAVLIGMLKASYTYNPRVNPKKALDRRNTVLDQMVRNNFLSADEAAKLKIKPIELNYKKLDETTGLGPYFRMVLGEEMKKWCKEHKKSNGDNYDLYRDGLKLYTTINPKMQFYAEEAVAKHMSYMQQLLNKQDNIKKGTIWKGYENVIEAAIKSSDRWRNAKKDGMSENDIRGTFNIPTHMKIFAWNNNREKDTVMTPYDSIKYSRQMMQAGFMAMDPLSGEVRAWVGGIDFKTYKYDHVNYNTKRQVGSTIKPLLYSLAIDEAGFTPNTIVEDVQQSFGAYGMVPATSRSCSGVSMPMVEALTYSRNCATAYIMKQLDGKGNNAAKRFVDFLKNKCALQTKIEPNPSIAIGACEISLYEMMQAYTMFPGRGFNVKPLFLTRIEDKNGNVLENFAPQRKEVISDVSAYSVIKMMQEVTARGTARRIWDYGVQGAIAGKTGTTNDNADAWFMGYTPQLLGGVWVGCDDRFIRFNSEDWQGQGARAAMPIWGYFYAKVLQDPNLLGIDPKAQFVKPDVMQNDLNFDYINGTQPPPVGPGDEDMGNGTSKDYLPGNIKPEDLAPESTLPANPVNDAKKNNLPTDNKPKQNKLPVTPPPANKPNEQPKAIMPKKTTGTK